MKIPQRKTTLYTDAELMAEYREVTAAIAAMPGYSMDLDKRLLENRQDALIAEGLDRGLFRRP